MTELPAPVLAARPFAVAERLPVGLVLRHLRAPDDYPAMNAIANSIRTAEGTEFSTTDDQFAQFYDTLTDSDTRDDVAVAELGGEIVGYGRAAHHVELAGTAVYEVIPFVNPITTSPEIFVAMVAALEARARVIADRFDEPIKVLETFGGDLAPERDTLLREMGYEAVRYFFGMVRPTLDDLPDAALPEGLEIRDVRPEHLPAIWSAADEAFQDHWGYAPPGPNDYERFTTDPVTSDTTLWRIAWDGDEVAGQVRSFINAEENARLGRRRGYTEHIAVRRPWRRRGVARALVAASFPLLRARGMTEAALGVDAENPSGALRVYERCGFQRVSRTTTYRKSLA
jgi:ribosomal protein S18 acetylase RimI-like enzyme